MVKLDFTFSNLPNDAEAKFEVSALVFGGNIYFALWNGKNIVQVDTFPFSSNEINAKVKMRELQRKEIKDVNFLSLNLPCIHVGYNNFDLNHFDTYFAGIVLPNWVSNAVQKFEKFREKKIFSLYYLNQSSKEVIDNIFEHVDYFHISSAMANLVRKVQDVILCFIIEDSIHIVVQKDGSFHFYNQYECSDKNDFLYYILLVRSQFFEDENVAVQVGGPVDKKSALFQHLTTYVPNLSTYFSEKYEVDTIDFPEHFFLPFMGAKECG